MPNKEIKALEKEIRKLRSEPDSLELVDALNRIAYACLHSDPHKSEAYALEAYGFASNLGLESEKAKSDIVLVAFHLEAGNFDEALSHCRSAMDIYESLEDKHGIASVHSRLGNIFLVQGLIDKALEHYHMALKKKQECDVGRKELASFYFNIGACYSTLDRLELAISFYEHAESVWEESDNHPKLLYLYNNIGTVFGKKKELDNAREYFLKALDLCEELGEKKTAS